MTADDDPLGSLQCPSLGDVILGSEGWTRTLKLVIPVPEHFVLLGRECHDGSVGKGFLLHRRSGPSIRRLGAAGHDPRGGACGGGILGITH
ncbi:MAG: hypothetical protein OXC26_24530 [Albidovulum sp.]|nr:hypothetical protein [Albidovulum sp.]